MSQTKESQAAATVEGKKPGMGRPSTFTTQVGDLICARIAEGESLRAVCRDEGMPGRATVFRWRDKNPAFDGQYTRAREMLYEHWADELLEIADDSTTDMITKTGRNGSTYEAVDQEHIQRSRLRVDTRRWLLSKLMPKQFGDRIGVEVGGEVLHKLELSDRERMRRFALFMLEDRAAGVTIEGEATCAKTWQAERTNDSDLASKHGSGPDTAALNPEQQ